MKQTALRIATRSLRSVPVMLAAFITFNSGQLSANGNSDEYKNWVRERNKVYYSEKTPEALMGLLPASLREAHIQEVELDREWFEGVWSLGQPEFFIQDLDTLVQGRDTTLAVLFSDGRVSQVVTVRLEDDRRIVLPATPEPIATGLLAMFRPATPDLDHDGRQDLAVIHGGGAHSSVLRVYLWRTDRLVPAGVFASDVGLHEFQDVNNDGIVEIVVGSRAIADSGAEAVSKEVFRLEGDKFLESKALTRALLGAESIHEKK